MSAWQCIMAAYCDMALLFFIETTTVTWSLNTRLQVFFALDDSNFIPTLFQLYSNFIPTIRKNRTVQNYPGTVQLFQTFIYQYLNYQIIDVIQLNRAKFIFNWTKKKKPNIREDVRPFPTSKRTSIKWWSNIDDLQVSE